MKLKGQARRRFAGATLVVGALVLASACSSAGSGYLPAEAASNNSVATSTGSNAPVPDSSSSGSSTPATTSATASPTVSTSPAVSTVSETVEPTTETSPTTETAPATTDLLTTVTTPTPTTSAPPVVKPAAKVKISPEFGATGISPVTPISIVVTTGTLTSLTMVNGEGTKVKGKLSADKSTWNVGEPLGYGKTYTVTGVAKGENGKSLPIQGSYQTVSPADQITTSISPGDGAVVGIAQPVIVRFGFTPADPDAVLKAMKITTTPKVEGAWAWITHDGDDSPSLDWRPKDYWPANTKVHVESNIYGVKFTDSYYGGDNVTSDFTIGRSQVVYADARTYQIIVKQGCTRKNDPDSCKKTTATYPASYGMGDDPDSAYGLMPQFVTRSGIHVVIDKQTEVMMQLPGYYEPLMEYWAVRMSNNGEFLHQNESTVDVQGVRNVSHGCINLSPKSAEAYYKSALVGDPVEVIGTSVPLSAADGDVYDWTIPWKTWLTMDTFSV